MTEEEFDLLLEKASEILVEKEFQEKIEDDEIDFSKRHKKQMKKLFKMCRKKTKDNKILI